MPPDRAISLLHDWGAMENAFQDLRLEIGDKFNMSARLRVVEVTTTLHGSKRVVLELIPREVEPC